MAKETLTLKELGQMRLDTSLLKEFEKSFGRKAAIKIKDVVAWLHGLEGYGYCEAVMLIQDAELTKALVANGANVQAGNNYALHEAANRYRYAEIVKILVDNGADVHVADDLPLYFAASNGDLEVVKILLANGANVHARGGSILSLAKIGGYTDVVKVLEKAMKQKAMKQ